MPQPRHTLRATALSFAAQLTVYLGLWFLLAGTWSLHELYVALPFVVLATVGSTLAWPRRPFAADLRAVSQVWRLPKYVATGTGEILVVLWRQLFGRRPAESLLLAVPFEGGPDERAAKLRGALAVAYTSATPNFLVLGIDPERGVLLYHQVKLGPIPEMTRRLGARG